MKIYVARTVTIDGREVEALVPIEAEAVRSEFTGIMFATERRAGGPFTAYYVHEEPA